jgi:ComF family protein
MMQFSLLARRAARVALDAVLPPTCLSCTVAVAEPGTLCAACWGKIAWLEAPLCACCGLPFPVDGAAAGDLLCMACGRERPVFARARAAFGYDEASKGLILGFKHADRLHAAPAFGRWMARAGADILEGADIVCPVPLHWTRLAWRRFNQSAVLARAAAGIAGKPYVGDLLVRRRRTPQQGDLGVDARRRNVRAAFAVARRHRGRVDGARVAILDDVLTTGATVGECARTLLKEGARAVDVITLARVVRPLPG